MPNYQKGLGRKGITALKLDKFKERYEWQLEEYSEAPQKLITSIPLKDYYKMGIFCIENKITIEGFV
ncbi:MAG: hypothetical protein JJV88_01410, partial [Sulfurovum sp.]|nr:hypothetical protein [Sulfurovaceae bacterium]